MAKRQTDLDAEVAALKARIIASQKDRAKAEHAHAVAQDRVIQLTEALDKEFGISPDEVPYLLENLEDDLAREVEKVRKLLAKAEEES